MQVFSRNWSRRAVGQIKTAPNGAVGNKSSPESFGLPPGGANDPALRAGFPADRFALDGTFGSISSGSVMFSSSTSQFSCESN